MKHTPENPPLPRGEATLKRLRCIGCLFLAALLLLGGCSAAPASSVAGSGTSSGSGTAVPAKENEEPIDQE